MDMDNSVMIVGRGGEMGHGWRWKMVWGGINGNGKNIIKMNY